MLRAQKDKPRIIFEILTSLSGEHISVQTIKNTDLRTIAPIATIGGRRNCCEEILEEQEIRALFRDYRFHLGDKDF